MMPRLLGVFDGNEAAAAVFLILLSTLSVCAAFFIYRAVKGKREKSNGVNVLYRPKTETEIRPAEENEDWSKSTGRDSRCPEDCESGSGEAVILSTSSHTPTCLGLPEEDIREATHDALYKSADCSSKLNSITDENYVKCKVISDDDIIGRSVLHDYHYKNNKPVKAKDGNSVMKNTQGTEYIETEQHIDMDESSETESAQENLEVKNVPVNKCQSMEDLSDNAFLTQDNVIKDSGGGEIITTGIEAHQKTTKMDDVETIHKSFDTTNKHLPQINCNDEKSDLLIKLPYKEVIHEEVHELTTSNNNDQNLSRKYDHQFICPGEQNKQVLASPELQSNSTAPPQILDERKGTADATVVVSQNKNEISIMEAIMDNNEWLSFGSVDTRDLPWLTQSNTKNDSKTQSSSPASANHSFGIDANDESDHEKMRGSPVHTINGVNNDEVLNKTASTMLPMPQSVLLSFRVHYITNSSSQILAVTGNQQELGDWKSFVPLRCAENGFWFRTIKLPVNSEVEWKFVVVEEGKIWRWEECANRRIELTVREKEIYLDKNWGYA